MYGYAVGFLPHIAVGFNIIDSTAYGCCTAISINCTTNNISDYGSRIHCKATALNPNCTCGANLALSFSFGAVCYCGILNYTAFCHNKLCLVGNADSRHTAEVPQHRAITQRDRGGDGGVGGDDGVLHTGLVVD